MRASDFGLGLIIAEEHERDPASPVVEPSSPPEGSGRELVVVNRTGFTTADAYHVQEPGIEFPIRGPGTLDSVVVIADSDAFDVYLQVDDVTVVDDSYQSLAAITTELNRVSAYEGSAGFVFAATDYEYQSMVDCVITPRESITFRRQRAEVDVVRNH